MSEVELTQRAIAAGRRQLGFTVKQVGWVAIATAHSYQKHHGLWRPGQCVHTTLEFAAEVPAELYCCQVSDN